jgi:putative nucleotidyltransferase with HDIG domain
VKPALELLFKTRLLGYLLPEVYPITMTPRNQTSPTKDLWYHTKVVVNKSKSSPRVRWAALLHDIAKPQTFTESSSGTHFFQHEYLGAEIADGLLKRLKAGAATRHAVRGLIALHQRIGDVVSRRNNPPVSTNALRRLTRDCDERKCRIEDLIELFAADCSSGRKEVVERQRVHANLLRKALKDMRAEDLRPKLPKGIGERLMKHFNLKPGPEVGKLKQKLDTMLVSGKINPGMTAEQMCKLLEE